MRHVCDELTRHGQSADELRDLPGTNTKGLWHQFAHEYNKLAIHTLGGNASPIQTQWLQAGDVKIPKKLARPRFTTTFYEKFLN